MSAPQYKRKVDRFAFLEPIGTTEDDIEPTTSVWPALGPDMDAHIASMRRGAIAVGLTFCGLLLFGFGVFIGWVIWA